MVLASDLGFCRHLQANKTYFRYRPEIGATTPTCGVWVSILLNSTLNICETLAPGISKLNEFVGFMDPHFGFVHQVRSPIRSGATSARKLVPQIWLKFLSNTTAIQ